MLKPIKKVDKTPIIESQLLKASTALLEYMQKVSEGANGKRILMEDERTIKVEVVFQRFQIENNLIPVRLDIPHSFTKQAEICIFTKAPQSTYREMFKETNISGKVISIDKLKKKYKQYEARSKLAGSFDIFMADERVISKLPKYLGSSFFRSKKLIPLTIPQEKFTKKFQRNISSARDATYYHPGGRTGVFNVGNKDLTAQQITDNVLTAMSKFVRHIPRGWKNIQSLALSIHGIPSLPFFVVAPEGSLIRKRTYEGEMKDEDENEDNNESGESDELDEDENGVIRLEDEDIKKEMKGFQSESDDDDDDDDDGDYKDNDNDNGDDDSSEEVVVEKKSKKQVKIVPEPVSTPKNNKNTNKHKSTPAPKKTNNNKETPTTTPSPNNNKKAKTPQTPASEPPKTKPNNTNKETPTPKNNKKETPATTPSPNKKAKTTQAPTSEPPKTKLNNTNKETPAPKNNKKETPATTPSPNKKAKTTQAPASEPPKTKKPATSPKNNNNNNKKKNKK